MSKPPSPRPLSIKILVLIYLWSFLTGMYSQLRALALLPRSGNIRLLLVGPLVPAWVTVLLNVLLALLSLYIAIGLWRLQEIARRVAVLLNCCELLWLFIILIQWREGGWLFIITQVTFGASIPALGLWFLIKRKSAFVKRTQSV